MNIASLTTSAAGGLSADYNKLTGAVSSGDGENFSNILDQVMDMTESTGTQDKSATLSLLTGQTDDVAGLLIDSQKAEVALGLTVQLRNKLMDAYNEVMNMQV